MSHTIPEKAIDQFREATTRFLFTDEGVLHANAFGPYPAFRLEPHMKDKIETQLGESIETASQSAVLGAVEALATTNERFFQDLQARMPKFGVLVPFYSDIDDHHGRMRPISRPADIDVSALIGGHPLSTSGGHMQDTTNRALAAAAAARLVEKVSVEIGAAKAAQMPEVARDLDLHTNPGYQPPVIDRAAVEQGIQEGNARARAARNKSFVSTVAHSPVEGMTPDEIAARSADSRRAVLEDRALGPKHFARGTTTPAGVEDSRAPSDDGIIKR
jgi:hypothetical protein